MKQKKLLSSVVFVLLVLSSSSGCSKKKGPGNVLRVALKDDVKTLDPANEYDSVGNEVLPNVMETLLQYKYLEDINVLEPRLSDGMPEYSKDGLTVTVKIKKGIMFADDPCFKATSGKGRELKAQDFIYGFKRLAIPAIQSQGSWVFEGKLKGFNEFEKALQAAKPEEFKKVFDGPVEGFSAKDDYTLEFKLTQPYPILNYILAMNFTSPVAPESAEMYADKDGNMRDHPVGTGPFILKSWETNQKIVLVKNPGYREAYPSQSGSERLKSAGFLKDAGKALPLLDGLVFEIVKEEQDQAF